MTSATVGNDHIRHEMLVCGISNAIINGLSAWLLFKSGPSLHWGGDHSFMVDVLATSFLLPLITALIIIPLQRSKLRKGKLNPINLGATSLIQSLANRFPASAFKSALAFGLIGMLMIAPLTLGGFYLFGVEEASAAQYTIFKGLWAGLIAAVLVVPMILIALREPESLR
jgi:hypothetical protein